MDCPLNNAKPEHIKNKDFLVARAWLAHVMREATRLNRARRYEDAREMIESELKHSERYAQGLPEERELALRMQLLARRADREFSPRLSKELTLRFTLMAEGRVDRRWAEKEAWYERIDRGE